MDNYMSLKIKAISANEGFARSVSAAFCVGLNPTIDQINDIKTAVSEAVTNSIVHGYKSSGEGTIQIDAWTEATTIHIVVKDDGVGISDITKARMPFYTTKPEEERSGMGFTVMESFMDTLTVENNIEHGVIVHMTKNLAANTNKNGENKDC